MKKFFVTASVFFIGLSAFSQISVDLQNNKEYIFFADGKIQSIKSNNPYIISAQRVMTYNSEDNQMIIYTKKCGVADVKVQTDKGQTLYTINIQDKKVKDNSLFMELDMPEVLP